MSTGKPTAVLLCPGRGSYGKDELGAIARHLGDGPVRAALDAADAARRARGEPTVRDLDRAAAFKPSLHLAGRNAAELIYFATLAQTEALLERYDVIGVGGNSLGWYTALAAAGAVDPLAGWTVVETMARLQESVAGGQVLTTMVDDRWHADPALAAAVEAALAAVNRRGDDHYVAWSIRLGGHAVLAGTEAGVAALLAELPPVQLGERRFPFRLAGHGPFHTRLCQPTAERAARELANLGMVPPQRHLIDGHGRIHTPWSADPRLLLHYTTGAQVTTTFDFTATVRVAMRELQPDVLLCAGPGTSLRAPVGHAVVAEGWRGIGDRDAVIASGLVVAG